jgi:protein O-mannosyl-transferase
LVAWVTELKNTQSGFFYLLAVLLFLKWQDVEGNASWRKSEPLYGLALVCAVLAILSKASTAMLPVILGLCWWWRNVAWSWVTAIRLAPFFLVSAIASAWTIWEQRFHSGAIGPEWGQTGLERLSMAGSVVWFYLGKLLWPHPLIFIYRRWQIDASSPSAYLPVVAVALALSLLWWSRSGWARPLCFAFTCFVVSLFPVMGFFNVYFFRFSFVGDHLQYLATLAMLPLSGVVLARGLARWRLWGRWQGKVICLTLGSLLAALSWRQCAMYHCPECLWRTTLAQNPDCWMAHNNWGLLLAEQGKLDQAIAHYQRALRLKSDYTDARVSLGVALRAKGRYEEAMAQFVAALKLNPNHLDARNNLGVVLLDLGRSDEALAQFGAVLKLNARDAAACYNAGNSLARQGKRAEAIAFYRASLQVGPADAALHNILAACSYWIKTTMRRPGIYGQPSSLSLIMRERTTPSASL